MAKRKLCDSTLITRTLIISSLRYYSQRYITFLLCVMLFPWSLQQRRLEIPFIIIIFCARNKYNYPNRVPEKKEKRDKNQFNKTQIGHLK